MPGKAKVSEIIDYTEKLLQ